MKHIYLIACILISGCTTSTSNKIIYSSSIVSHYSIRTNSPRNSTITASGIPLDDSKRTAAHKTLPFGTRVRVIREDNPKLQTIVVITDRGPYIAGRILDVSQAAAKDLQMISRGIVKCTLEILD
jgi:rare lipoprotein A